MGIDPLRSARVMKRLFNWVDKEALILLGAFLALALVETIADLFGAAMAFLFN